MESSIQEIKKMSKGKELAKNTIIILFGKLCTQLITFLMLPLYTNILSAEKYGAYDLIVTYISLALPIVSVHMEMGAFRYLIDCRKNNKDKTQIISNAIIAITISAAIFAAIFTLVGNIVSLPYFPSILACAVATLLSNLFLQIARGLGDNIGFSIGSIIAGIATVALNIVFLLVFNMGIEGILFATALANICCVLFLVSREHIPGYFKPKQYSKNEVFKLLKYSAPLVPNSLIWWIIGVSDRTIISIFMNIAANGVYAVSNKFSTILSAVYGIFNLSWTESASLHINDEDRDEFFSKTFNTTIKLFVSMSLLILAAMPILFDVLIGPGYEEAYLYIPVLMIGMLFNVVVSFIGAIYIAKKKTKEVAMTSLWSGILNIVINVALIKFIGLWAASFSTLLAFLIMSIYRYFDVQKYVKLKLDLRFAMVIGVLTAACVILYYFDNIPSSAINIVIVLAASLLLNRGAIKTITKSMKAKFLG